MGTSRSSVGSASVIISTKSRSGSQNADVRVLDERPAVVGGSKEGVYCRSLSVDDPESESEAEGKKESKKNQTWGRGRSSSNLTR